jgi:hypothetical protein
MAESIAFFLYSAMPMIALFACALGACCENLVEK